MWSAALAVLVLLFATSTAWGQSGCAPGEAMARALRETYGEELRTSAEIAPGRRVFFYVNPRNGTWTMTETGPRAPGVQCLVGDGVGWTPAPSPPPGAPA